MGCPSGCRGKTKLVWTATLPDGTTQTYDSRAEAAANTRGFPPGTVAIRPKEVTR